MNNEYTSLINKYEDEYNLPRGLLFATIKNESAFNPNAVSESGAIGLGQLMPDTAKEMGVKDPYSPEENIMGAAKYQRKLMDMFGNDPKLAVMAYHAGPGNIQKYGENYGGPKTQAYTKKVMEDYMPELGQMSASADFQKMALDEQRKQMQFQKQMEAEGNAMAEAKKSFITERLSEPETYDSRLPMPVTNKKSNLTDLILPILGAAAGAAFGGPAGALFGLGGGALKTMEMKNQREKTSVDQMSAEAERESNELLKKLVLEQEASKQKWEEDKFNQELDLWKQLLNFDQSLAPEVIKMGQQSSGSSPTTIKIPLSGG